MEMKDPFNPTHQEIIEWAYDTKELYPAQDWDLTLARCEYGELMLKLASDQNCPKKEVFISCLYILVGDTVRSKGKAHNVKDVMKIMDSAEKNNDPLVVSWLERSKYLISHPETYSCEIWGEGNYKK